MMTVWVWCPHTGWPGGLIVSDGRLPQFSLVTNLDVRSTVP